MRYTLDVRLKGGLLLGGAGSGSSLNATLRRTKERPSDTAGAPFIPASALKGAIREQLQRLLADKEQVEAILGREGMATRADGSSTGVFLTDADLAEDAAAAMFAAGHGYATRTQVSIDRRTRRAADAHLFSREVVAPFAGLVFRAEADTSALTDEQRAQFVAGARSVFAIGAGRTGGLGAVEMEVEPLDTAAARAAAAPAALEAARAEAVAASFPQAGDLELVLETVDPLCLGASRWFGNFHESLHAIAASILRGAVTAAALAERGETRDLSADPLIRRLVIDSETCMRFGDAVPVAGCDSPPPRRAPFTLRTCKLHNDHGAGDALLRGFVQQRLADRGVFRALVDACGTCGERTVAATGWRGAAPLRTRVVTRLGLDAASGRGADQKLFSLELVERGMLFCTRIANVDDEGRALLADAIKHGLRVGRGRGQGYGRVRVVHVREAPKGDLEQRIKALDQCVAGFMETLERANTAESGVRAHAYVVAMLESDQVVEGQVDGDAGQAMLSALDLPNAVCLAAQVRASRRGGFDTLGGAQKPLLPAVAASSTMLLRLERPIDEDLIQTLARKEARGIGARREEGCGWVRFSDPVHIPGWRTT